MRCTVKRTSWSQADASGCTRTRNVGRKKQYESASRLRNAELLKATLTPFIVEDQDKASHADRRLRKFSRTWIDPCYNTHFH